MTIEIYMRVTKHFQLKVFLGEKENPMPMGILTLSHEQQHPKIYVHETSNNEI